MSCKSEDMTCADIIVQIEAAKKVAKRLMRKDLEWQPKSSLAL